MDFAILGEDRVKAKSENKDKYQDLTRGQGKKVEYEGYGDTNCN